MVAIRRGMEGRHGPSWSAQLGGVCQGRLGEDRSEKVRIGPASQAPMGTEGLVRTGMAGIAGSGNAAKAGVRHGLAGIEFNNHRRPQWKARLKQ